MDSSSAESYLRKLGINTDRPVVIEKAQYLSDDEFGTFVDAVRALGGQWLPGGYRAAIPAYKLALAPDIWEKLKGIKGLRINGGDYVDQLIKSGVLEKVPDVALRLEGNDIILTILNPSLRDKIAKYLDLDYKKGGFTAYRQVYSPSLREYIEKPFRFYRMHGNVVILRRGFGPRIMAMLEKVGAKKIDDSDVKFDVSFDLSKITVPLRNYQRIALEGAAKQIEKFGGATILAATGSGKTEIGLAAIQALDGRAVVIVPSRDLVYQWVDRAKKYGIPIGVAYADVVEVPEGAKAIVTTNATAWRSAEALRKAEEEASEGEAASEQGGGEEEEEEEEGGKKKKEEEKVSERAWKTVAEWMKSAKLIIYDEAHHLPANTVRKTALATPQAAKLGLSATPWRNDDWDMTIYGLAGEIIPFRITSSYLIEQGYLVPVRIYRLHTGISGKFYNYKQEKSKVLNDPVRIELLANVLKNVPLPALVLVGEVKVGENVMKGLQQYAPELKAAFIHGKLNEKERAKLIDQLRKGELQVLVATTLADEGLDIPNLRSLILYFPGKSRTRVFQRIGRVTRQAEGKKFGVVVEFVDDTKAFKKQAEDRKELYETEPKWSVVDVRKPEEIKQDVENFAKALEEEERKKAEEKARKEAEPQQQEEVKAEEAKPEAPKEEAPAQEAPKQEQQATAPQQPVPTPPPQPQPQGRERKKRQSRGWLNAEPVMFMVPGFSGTPEAVYVKSWRFGPFMVDAYKLVGASNIDQIWVYRRPA